jgi:hypothetical protein
MYSSSLLFSDFLKSDVCWFTHSNNWNYFFYMIDNGYSDHENLTHLKGAFVQSSNIQYHVVDWRHKCLENKLRAIECERWGELDSDIIVIRPSDGFINTTKICKQEAGVIVQRLSENQAHQRVRLLQEELGLSSKSSLIDVTYGGHHHKVLSSSCCGCRWHNGWSEDFGVKEMRSVWIDNWRQMIQWCRLHYTSRASGSYIQSSDRSWCTQETGTRYRWYVNVSSDAEIDLVTNDEVIEIKFVKRIQSCTWSSSWTFYPGKSRVSTFFLGRGGLWGRFVEHIGDLYEDFNVRLRMKSFRHSTANSKRIVSCLGLYCAMQEEI